MKPFDTNCDKPSAICRWMHRPWWVTLGTRKQCTSCGACWDVRERPGASHKATPEMILNKEKDNEVRLLGLPAILEGTDQIRINYAGQVIRVTHLENIGPMIRCRWINGEKTTMLCVHRNTVVPHDQDRLGRMGGAEKELVWESDGKKFE